MGKEFDCKECKFLWYSSITTNNYDYFPCESGETPRDSIGDLCAESYERDKALEKWAKFVYECDRD